MGSGDHQDQPGAQADTETPEQALSKSPREFGDRLLSVTESIQRELDQLRHVSAEQERREQQLEQREAEAAERERKVGEAAEALRDAKAQLEQDSAAVSAREAEVAAKALEAQQRIEEAQQREATLAEREASTAQHAATLSAQQATLESARLALEETERELVSDTERLAAQKRILREREQTVGERESTCDAREAEVATLQSTAASASESVRRIAAMTAELESAKAALAHAETLRHELEQAQSQAAELTQRTTELEAALSVRPAGGDEQRLQAEIARRDEALGLMRDRLKAAVAERDALEARLADSPAEPASAMAPGSDNEMMALRRERLRRLKALLEERARKVIRAREALAKKAAELAAHGGAETPGMAEQREKLEARAAEAEKVLALRAALSERQALLEKQAKVVSKKAAKGAAGLLAASFSIMLAVSAVAGWMLAGEFSHATFLAQSTISMETAADQLRAEHVKGWMDFHGALANDPQLIEKTAERMRRRGYTELGTPVALTEKLRADMDVQPGAPGELTLTLRGEGQARTEAVLDTLTSAIVQMANDSRDRRADAVGAIVKRGATADPRPISDARLPMFGMIGGGMAGVSLCLWLVACRGLSRRSLITPEDVDDIV